jgi:hypothetical protein
VRCFRRYRDEFDAILAGLLGEAIPEDDHRPPVPLDREADQHD